jgi:hypothetical protein
VPVTATPYAGASAVEEPNPTTSTTTATARARLIPGRYTWRSWLRDVWRMLIRGRNPSWIACRVRLNAPEITACDAITVATVARTTIGTCAHAGTSR